MKLPIKNRLFFLKNNFRVERCAATPVPRLLILAPFLVSLLFCHRQLFEVET
jgi:hypothetical protein